MATFTDYEQQAEGLLAERLRDDAFRLRLESTSGTWGIDHATLLRRVRVVIAMGLLYGGRENRDAEEPARRALDVLRRVHPVELFGVLPADLGPSARVVEQLRLLSTGVTPGGPLAWERLIQTARNVLDGQAVYPAPDSADASTQGPSRTTGTLSTASRPAGPQQ
jgi:hypothetical protein